MSIGELIRAMSAAGAPAEAIALAVDAIEAVEAKVDATRAAARDRKRRQRAREAAEGEHSAAARDRSVTVTGQSHPKCDIPPAPDKKTPDPKKLTPTPCVHVAPACEAEPELPSPMQVLLAWLAIEAVISAATAKRWKGMPPPQGVSAEQWRGFLDHRKAMRHTLTDRGYHLLIAKLAKHATADWPPGRIIDLIVERGWRSFEPDWLPKANDQNGFHRNRPGRIAADQHPGGRTGAAADAVFGGGPVP